MRSKKAIKNTIFSLLEDFVAIVCSFILPKLILSHFGSAYNGLTTSITQFLACAVLLRSGIGGATKAALYKPLANKKEDEINAILRATDIFMKKIGIILGISIVVFASIYPFITNTNFSWLFTFSLFVIIGISTFAESFFGITYLILLQADQKLYVSSIFKIVGYIVNVALASLLILSDQSIHIVKLGSAIAFCIHPIALNLYVRKKYNINNNVEPNNKAINQRWDAFWHQIAVFVNNNTDVMVLTVFTNMLEVSVYSVYALIVSGLKRFIIAFTQGVDAAFGNMIAKGEKKQLNENIAIIELI
ncbi:sugar isomerase, partial [bacterium]|nr:sugar isomerase [bacterium]